MSKKYLINPFTSIESEKIQSLGEFNDETLWDYLSKDFGIDIYEYYYQFEDDNYIEGGFIYQCDFLIPKDSVGVGFEVKNCDDYILYGYGKKYPIYGKSVFYDESENSSEDTIDMLKKLISFN